MGKLFRPRPLVRRDEFCESINYANTKKINYTWARYTI